jgi:hypothetical protein
MRKIKETKILQVLNIKNQGLDSADATKILGYGRSTVEVVYSGNYEMIPFIVPGKWKLEEETVMTPQGPATRIDKQGYEFQDYDEYVESTEDAYIRKEEAEYLYDVLDTLSAKDRDIIQAKADGQSNRQIITEFSTSAHHIKKIQNNLKRRLDMPRA